MPDAIAASVGSGQYLDALQYDFFSGQVVAVGVTAASSAAFVNPYTAATITSTTNCWYSIGATAVAHGAASEYLPANTKIKVKFAAGQTISVIQDTAGGFLSITPASNPNVALSLLDTLPAAAAAYSLRRLSSAYLGACINVRRSSDNTFQDIGFTAAGDLDIGAFNTFIGAGQGFVRTWYDQSGNANNATQATAASQPQLITGIAALNNRTAIDFGAGNSALSLGAPASASLDGVFANGGWASLVTQITGPPPLTDYFLNKTGWLIVLGGGPTWQFLQVASTTNGVWNVAISIAAHQYDVAYSSASLSNVPTVFIDGANIAPAPTQPVGTITSDSGQTLVLGNNLNAGGSRGIPGRLAEVILYKSQPAPGPIRANQKTYWGTP